MGISGSIDITVENRKMIQGLLQKFLPNTTVWAYGSRVKWTARPLSDLDMVVFSSPEQKLAVANLKDAFEDSSMPFIVDLFIWDEVPEQFHKNIKAEHVVLQEKTEIKMPSEWKEAILVDCLDALIDYRGKTPKKSDHGVLTLSAKSVKMGRIHYNQAYFISKETYDKFMVRGFPKKGDILLTSEAPLGCVARLDRDDVGLAQRLLTLRGNKNLLDNGYLGIVNK